jgi:hypothetical protein
MKLEGAARVYAPVIAVLGLVLLLFVANQPLSIHHGRARAVASDGGPFSAAADGARYRLDAASAKSSGALHLSDDTRRAGFRFEASVAPADRQVFLDAVAAARPEARRVIGLVDGLVTIRVGPTGVPGAIGLTEDVLTGYRVTIDLGVVATRYGPRGVQRTVLHELGHVVDFALVTDDMLVALDAGVPPGVGCEDGRLGGCANREERFAETFAKWALGDIGVNLYVGYKVPPPSAPLDVWGAPLARLAAAG